MWMTRRDALRVAAAFPTFATLARAQDINAGTRPEPASLSVSSKLMSPNDIEAMLKERIDVGKDSVGYVAGTIDSGGNRIVTAGRSGTDDDRPLDGDSVFEIGSITKVFTAILLFTMVRDGEVALDDPVAKYLPPEGRPQAFDGKPMSLLDLANYTSGLPRMPDNFKPKDPSDPYVDYGVDQLYAFIAGYKPRYYPGSHYIYANLGFGLLGHVLALKAGKSYEDLLVSRVCDPLGLNDTRITLSPSMQQRLVQGHGGALQKVANWDFLALAGCGALRSTSNDLLRFLGICMGRIDTPLAPLLPLLLDVRRQAGRGTVAAGWFVENDHDDEIVFKDGGTGGYTSLIAYSTHSQTAAVLLSNSETIVTHDLGLRILNTDFPAPHLVRPISLDPAKLDRYVGYYPLSDHFALTVWVRDGQLVTRGTGQEPIEIFPESETDFYPRVVQAKLVFEFGPDGKASALTLYQNGGTQRGLRR